MWSDMFPRKEYLETNKWKNYKCPECGTVKGICMKKEYVYKIEGKYYCSYTCWRKGLRNEPKKFKKNNVVW